MASDIDNLLTARSALYAALASQAGKPNYTIDGQTVDRESIFRQIDYINAAINQAQGPVQVETQH